MSEDLTLMAIFQDLNPAVNGIEKLHEMGIDNEHINVHTGIPIKGEILGRPSPKTNVPRFGMLGAVLGMCLGIFFIQGIPNLYPLHVGGQSLFPVPPTLIITFEMTMLGLMGFSFIGMFLESRFPSVDPGDYFAEVSDGKIAIFLRCSSELQADAEKTLMNAGAEYVKLTEAQIP